MFSAFIFGLPYQLFLTSQINAGFSYQQFERDLKSALKNDDVVYSDFSSYFAAKSVAKTVFVATYGQTKFVDGIPKNKDISALMINENQLSKIKILISGNWVAGRTYKL